MSTEPESPPVTVAEQLPGVRCHCLFCGEQLQQPGGLIFSPPASPYSLCVKGHVCVACWELHFDPLFAPAPAPEDS